MALSSGFFVFSEVPASTGTFFFGVLMSSQSHLGVFAALLFLIVYWLLVEVYSRVIEHRFAPLLRDYQSG